MKIGTTGKFGGIGIEITMEDGFVKIITPIDDTPAQRAGLKAGDLVIEVQDISLKDKSINDLLLDDDKLKKIGWKKKRKKIVGSRNFLGKIQMQIS